MPKIVFRGHDPVSLQFVPGVEFRPNEPVEVNKQQAELAARLRGFEVIDEPAPPTPPIHGPVAPVEKSKASKPVKDGE